MANTTLSTLFTNIANTIRSKTGKTETIKAVDFPAEISNIYTGLDLTNLSFLTSDGGTGSSSLTANAENVVDMYVPCIDYDTIDPKIAVLTFTISSTDGSSSARYWCGIRVLNDGTTDTYLKRITGASVAIEARSTITVNPWYEDRLLATVSVIVTPQEDCRLNGDDGSIRGLLLVTPKK